MWNTFKHLQRKPLKSPLHPPTSSVSAWQKTKTKPAPLKWSPKDLKSSGLENVYTQKQTAKEQTLESQWPLISCLNIRLTLQSRPCLHPVSPTSCDLTPLHTETLPLLSTRQHNVSAFEFWICKTQGFRIRNKARWAWPQRLKVTGWWRRTRCLMSKMLSVLPVSPVAFVQDKEERKWIIFFLLWRLKQKNKPWSNLTDFAVLSWPLLMFFYPYFSLGHRLHWGEVKWAGATANPAAFQCTFTRVWNIIGHLHPRSTKNSSPCLHQSWESELCKQSIIVTLC